jgi:hypothetical protein
MCKTKSEPDHGKFIYHVRDMDQWGAIRGCICKTCEARRQNKKEQK